MTRVQIPDYYPVFPSATPGDRTGDVVKTVSRQRRRPLGKLGEPVAVDKWAHVKLDLSRKTIVVRLEDCKVLGSALATRRSAR